jgi:hypothetical protein
MYIVNPFRAMNKERINNRILIYHSGFQSDLMLYNSRTRKSPVGRRAVTTISTLSLLVAGVLLTYPTMQSVTYAQGNEEQTITQIAQQVATVNPGTSQEKIEQTMQQIATHI